MNWRNWAESLERIASSMEHIERILARAFPPEQLATGVNGMPLPTGPVAPGASDTATYTAVDAAGNTVAGPITFASSDDTQLAVQGDGSTTGVSVVTWTYQSGSPVLTATFTNTDGSTVDTGTNDPFTFTGSVSTDLAVAVNGV
jgi:hypothetical protein